MDALSAKCAVHRDEDARGTCCLRNSEDSSLPKVAYHKDTRQNIHTLAHKSDFFSKSVTNTLTSQLMPSCIKLLLCGKTFKNG